MTEETVTAEETQVQDQNVEQQQEVKTPEDTSKNEKDHNWNEAREVLRLQKQRIEELEARVAQVSLNEKKEEVDDVQEAFKSLGLDKEDSITAEQALILADKIADKKSEKKARQIVQEYAQQQQILQDELRMRSKHDDFDYVIENFAVPMIKNDPALAYKIQTSRNPAETAYKLAKISDEYEEAKMKQQTSPKAEKILKNTSRPTSANSVGSPLKNQADDFSKLSPQEIWSMSQKYARSA